MDRPCTAPSLRARRDTCPCHPTTRLLTTGGKPHHVRNAQAFRYQREALSRSGTAVRAVARHQTARHPAPRRVATSCHMTDPRNPPHCPIIAYSFSATTETPPANRQQSMTQHRQEFINPHETPRKSATNRRPAMARSSRDPSHSPAPTPPTIIWGSANNITGNAGTGIAVKNYQPNNNVTVLRPPGLPISTPSALLFLPSISQTFPASSWPERRDLL